MTGRDLRDMLILLPAAVLMVLGLWVALVYVFTA